MRVLGSVESTFRGDLHRLPWPGIVAALLIVVASLALALLLLLVSLRCADTYQLMTMTSQPGCALAAPPVVQVSANLRCTAPSLLYDQSWFSR